MADPAQHEPNLTWLLCAILALSAWGTYGVWIHAGVSHMNPGGADPNARYKAYLLVGAAYFIVAVMAPLIVLWINGATWSFPARGVWLSLLAGCVGALGAFFVLLAMGSVARAPWMIPVIMAVVFAGAPIVNAVVALLLHPPEGGWLGIKPQFYIGIVVAAVGATMVTIYKPGPAPPAPEAQAAVVSGQEPAERTREDAVQ